MHLKKLYFFSKHECYTTIMEELLAWYILGENAALWLTRAEKNNQLIPLVSLRKMGSCYDNELII